MESYRYNKVMCKVKNEVYNGMKKVIGLNKE